MRGLGAVLSSGECVRRSASENCVLHEIGAFIRGADLGADLGDRPADCSEMREPLNRGVTGTVN
jgi:hypothetical protein